MYFKNLSVDHLNMTVNNLNDSTSWYKKYFGFKIVEEGKGWNIIKSSSLMICQYETNYKIPQESKDIHKIFHFGLRISDKTSWEKVLDIEKFELFYNSPITYPNSTSWYIKDPSGHEIEVVYWNNDSIKF